MGQLHPRHRLKRALRPVAQKRFAFREIPAILRTMQNRAWPVSYNAPFALTFALVCVAAFLLALTTQGWTNHHVFSIGGEMNWKNPLT